MSEFKKVECTCSHGYTCRKMQDPNCCAHSCDYNDLVDAFNALQAERYALAAQVDFMQKKIKSSMSYRWSADIKSKLQEITDLTPCHHLAAHDAEVAKDAFKAGWLCRADRRSFKFEEESEKYAAQLRAKAKS